MKEQLNSERKKLLSSVEKLLEGPMIFLGFVWLILLVVELIWGLPPTVEYISLGIWGVFIIDFILKLILAPDKVTFFKINWLTAISLIIPALRVFRIFRFIRLLRGLRGIRLIRIVSSINRGMRSLGATMKRRAFGYVFLLTLFVTFVGAAGMYALERGNPGFENYGLALFGYTIFGYVTATFATYFIGRDAEEKDTPVAGAKDIADLKKEISLLTKSINELQAKSE
jgi:voltage-gated potassium channel